jgi:Rrf2 family protein
MLLPQTAEYAIRAVLYLARSADVVRVPDLATAINVPQNYLAKTMHHMARSGLLRSTRGPAGGFRLAVRPEEIPLQRIVELFEEPHDRRCLLGTGRCGHNPGCPVHERWKPIAEGIEGFFRRTTVADLLDRPFSFPPGVPAGGAPTAAALPC